MNSPKPDLPEQPPQFEFGGSVGLLAGLAWMTIGSNAGLGGLPTLLVGICILSCGVATIFFAGDRRINYFSAFSALLGLLLLVPLFWLFPIYQIFVILVSGLAVLLMAGYLALVQQVPYDGAPLPDRSAKNCAKVALDEVVLGYFLLSSKLPRNDGAERIVDEMARAVELIERKGWHKDGTKYHVAPPPFSQPLRSSARCLGFDYTRLSIASEFEAYGALPGSSRYMSYQKTANAHAWMLEHPGAPRPWILAIHGYRMGFPLLDMGLYSPRWFYERLGYNLLIPVLPLHGPRRIGWQSGDGYFDGEILDLLHAQTQALWDLRRWLGWLREEKQAPATAAMGISLGGFNTALLSNYDSKLACAIAGVPLADPAKILWRHVPSLYRDWLDARGAGEAEVRRVLAPIAPLSMKRKVKNAVIFGASGDRIVPPDQIRCLQDHWSDAETIWCPGGHLTFWGDKNVRQLVDGTLRAGFSAHNH